MDSTVRKCSSFRESSMEKLSILTCAFLHMECLYFPQPSGICMFGKRNATRQLISLGWAYRHGWLQAESLEVRAPWAVEQATPKQLCCIGQPFWIALLKQTCSLLTWAASGRPRRKQRQPRCHKPSGHDLCLRVGQIGGERHVRRVFGEEKCGRRKLRMKLEPVHGDNVNSVACAPTFPSMAARVPSTD